MKLNFGKAGAASNKHNEIISLDELKLSRPVPKEINRPKTLWEILEEIYSVLEENKIPFDQEAIYVDKASAINAESGKDATQTKLDHKRTDSFDQWTFNNIYTRIVIKDDLNEMEGAIGIAYNQYGIQLGFGLTYEDRHYFAHLGEEETIMSTYSCGELNVMAYFVMIHQIRSWFPFNNSNVIDQLERSRILMNKAVSFEFCQQFIERFYTYSLKYNDCLDSDTLIKQDDFRQYIEDLHTACKEQLSKKKKITAWNLYTLGNDLLMPEKDIPLTSIIPIGFIWGGYVFSRLI